MKNVVVSLVAVVLLLIDWDAASSHIVAGWLDLGQNQTWLYGGLLPEQ